MSDAFDPYYIWLGIPPEDQPPHHYRLLGVTLFENNREVIEAAANRQMAYMQEISAGDEHIDEAQKILGELSKARVCLLNEEKKAAYDAELRTSFDSLAPAPEQPIASKPEAAPAESTDPLMPPQLGKTAGQGAPVTDVPQVGKTAKHPQKSSKTKKKKSSSSFIIVCSGAVLVVLCIAATILFVSSQNAKKEKVRAAEIAKQEKDRKEREDVEQQLKIAEQKAVNADRKLKEKEEADRRANEEAEAERKANDEAEAERKANDEAEAERKTNEEAAAERKANEEAAAERKAKEEAAKEEAAEEEEARQKAVKYIESKGFVLIDKKQWWPEASYSSYKEVENDADSLNQGNLYETNPKEFWSQVRNLLAKQQQIQADLDAAHEPEFTAQLKILGQKPGELPEISWLKGTATSFLQDAGLEDTGKNVWRLKEEAKLKEAKDAESNPTADNLKQFNSAQVQLLKQAMGEYRKVTRKEFQDLLALGNKLGATQGADFGLGRGGKSGRGGKGWERFNFLGWHHPDTDASELGISKKSTAPFEKEALKASLERLQGTPAWQKASKKRSKANALDKKIAKIYRNLRKNNGVTVALEVVNGQLPPAETKK